MTRYDAVLFDFDGVLVDSEPVHYECWTEILQPFGITLDWQTYCKNCIGIADRAMISFLCSQSDKPVDIETLYAEYPRKKEMFRERMGRIGISAEIRELVNELSENYKLAVVTSSNIREVGFLLETAGLKPLLGAIVHGGEVERHKPAPDPYRLAMERLGAARGIAVEDSGPGIASAKAAGLDVVAIPAADQVCALVRAALRA